MDGIDCNTLLQGLVQIGNFNRCVCSAVHHSLLDGSVYIIHRFCLLKSPLDVFTVDTNNT